MQIAVNVELLKHQELALKCYAPAFSATDHQMEYLVASASQRQQDDAPLIYWTWFRRKLDTAFRQTIGV